MAKYDVAVVGGGIVGLAHAWMAARRGLSVVLLEKTTAAQGASVRNFGMVWPIGQPAGELYDVALSSRELWLELKSAGVLDVEECGSLHLAHREDELAVLEEFSALGTHQASMVSAEEAVQRSPLANPNNLLGAMQSATELRVNPRVASRQIAAWLSEKYSVECCFDTLVTHVQPKLVRAADGRLWEAERIIICSGSDLQTLYADEFVYSKLKLCKLQMLKTRPQSEITSGGPHIASGLTLRHYTSFEACPSLSKLKQRVAEETPELDRYGIHVMASALASGEIILGDSHEYESAISPFDKEEIDELILRELRNVIKLQDWTISERWHGIYAKHPTLPIYEREVDKGVHVFVGPGGAGMTMSFGLAQRAWKDWLGEN